MSTNDGELRNITRELLAELLPSLLQETLQTNGNGNGDGHHSATVPAPDLGAVPQVPAPPIAAVHRPTGWLAGDGAAPTSDESSGSGSGDVEVVHLRGDDDLNAFVRSIAARLDDPSQRTAITSGRRRFRLGGLPGSAHTPSGGLMRIEKGAVTERIVREAAEAGARLVLSPRAVITPMARDRARSLGVQIEKERRC